MSIRVFLLDDHEVVRQGLRHLLESEDGIEVVGEASTATEALNRIPATQPNVAVLDVRLGDGDGIEVCREVRDRYPEVACLMLTSFSDDEALVSAVMAGAAGYVLKDVKGNDLVESIRQVASGKSLLDPASTQRLLAFLRSSSASDSSRDDDRLTAQENRILDYIAEGYTNRQIGAEMHLAEKTVKNYVSNILTKLGMSRRTEAAVYAVRRKAGHERRL
jgi:two-component system response regulator DevR